MDGLKLNTLEIYGGAGGLHQGFHESGVIGTSYVVESDPAACETFGKNIPGATVYNIDAAKFLERAMKIDAGLVEALNGTDIPDCTFDNGLLTDGAIKFIFRVFTSLGYQCQHATLQAGAYCVPSSRKRVIFWASLPGYKLPKFPEPTNVFSCIPKDAPYIRRSAPHRPLTIKHCISDLPRWEFGNPHKQIKQTPEQKTSKINRGKTIAQYSILKNQKLVGLEKQDYASPHLCESQRQARKSVPDQLLHNHVTGRISVKQAERMCNVPLEAGADYRRMNEALLPNHLRKESERFLRNVNYRDRKFDGKYGRLPEDEIFKIITTANDQYSTNSWMLNPKLHRPYTIREIARAIGFSDSFIWDLETMKVSDALKQIGNAVPPPFARALGNELRKVLQDRNASRESNDDEDIASHEYIAIDDQADQNLNMNQEILAGSETDSDEEISNESEVEIDEDMEGQACQPNFESEDESGRHLDADEKVTKESDVDSDEDMDYLDDLESADENETNENADSEEESWVNKKVQREERINTGESRDDAIVIDDSE
ncbi:hypothetical protein EAF00_008269 [Botryotinia globosa]|nr:hypothetical protein EAF00_008269 [Botryotinia globosa]